MASISYAVVENSSFLGDLKANELAEDILYLDRTRIQMISQS